MPPLLVNHGQSVPQRRVGDSHEPLVGGTELQNKENRTSHRDGTDEQHDQKSRIEAGEKTEAKKKHTDPEYQHGQERPSERRTDLFEHQQTRLPEGLTDLH